MNRKSIIFLILFFGFFPNFIFSQAFGTWEILYKDNVTVVEVNFKIENASCTNNRKHLIQYRVSGKLSSFDYYLIWTTDYIDCLGKTHFQEHSLNISINNPSSNGSIDAYGDTWPSPEDEFQAESILTKFYDVHTSTFPSKKNGIKIPLKSTPADAIDGELFAIYGNSIELRIRGGSLGSGASWVWYTGNCGGNIISSGNSINITPTAETTYFVRAESATNKTSCVEKTIKIISKNPSQIFGNTEIFEGEETELYINDGVLMSDASWVWYENYNKIGTGSSIKVKPRKNTEYYIRAESPSSVSLNVKTSVKVKPNAPTSISGEKILVFGDSTELAVEGGFLLPNQQYVWYEDKIGGNKVGTGTKIAIRPLETAVYYVRAEGPGTFSGEIYAIVTVNDPTPIVGKNLPKIVNVNFLNNNGKIEISYDISNSLPSDRFNVSISGYKKNSKKLSIHSIIGDTSNLKGGASKKIIWDSKKDGYVFNEKIYFNISAKSELNIPFSRHLIKSLIFPGWGDLKLKTNKKTTLLMGLGGFALISGSVILNQQAKQSYKSYEKSFETEKSNKYYADALSKRNMSRILAFSASLVWTIDLAGLYHKYNKIKKNPTEENCPYYYNRSQQLINSNSKLQLINTKGQ